MAAIQVRLTRDEHRKIKKQAKENEISVSRLVRAWIEDAPSPWITRGDGSGSKIKRDA